MILVIHILISVWMTSSKQQRNIVQLCTRYIVTSVGLSFTTRSSSWLTLFFVSSSFYCLLTENGVENIFNRHFAWKIGKIMQTRSSWLNCALRDDEAVYWVSIGQYEAVAVGNWWYWVSRGHLCLYILHKVEIWTDVTDALRRDRLWKIGLISSL